VWSKIPDLVKYIPESSPNWSEVGGKIAAYDRARTWEGKHFGAQPPLFGFGGYEAEGQLS